jgi:hypothetical protein
MKYSGEGVHWACYVVLSHHGMTSPGVAGGGDGLQIWRITANILNKHSRKADKMRSSGLGLGEGLTSPHLKN